MGEWNGSRWVTIGTCRMYRESRGVYRALVGKTEGKRLFGTPRRRWEGNIKIDL